MRSKLCRHNKSYIFSVEEAIPPKPWVGTWTAKTMHKCMQYNHLTPPGEDIVIGDEDCLYVNIYTPELNENANLNVLVYIHGGAFMFNYGGQYGPDIILDHDIVLVNFNYRLGPLGFLSTEDDVVPGNNGIKDQILALKWIKENIHYFGGNPNSITISGMSAGGASVQIHYLLQQSKGLFHRGISMSGSVLNPWVIAENSLGKANLIADSVGCPTNGGSRQTVECLRKRTAREIVYATKYLQPWRYNPFSPFGVVVDSWATNPLFPDHPYNLLKNKKVADLPWLISYTSAEGLYPAAEFYNAEVLNDLNTNWNKIAPHLLDYNFTVDSSLRNSVSESVKTTYFGKEPISMFTFSTLVDLVSDRMFQADIDKSAKLHAAAVRSPVYSYYFSYRGATSKSEARANTKENLGASHGDDTSYILKAPMDTLSTENDRNVSKILVDMYVSFMDTGTPIAPVSWKPLSKKPEDAWNQLHIKGPSDLKMESKKYLGNRLYWDNLPIQENEHLPQSMRDEL